MSQIDTITQYILAIAPAVTALMGMIVVIGVGIGKIKKALSGNIEKVEKISSRTKEVEKQNLELKKQNVELKKALVELNKKIDIIDTIKAVKKD